MSLFFKIFLIAFLSLSFLVGGICFVLHAKVIDLSPLQQESRGRPSVILDEKGVEWARFQLDRSKFVSLDLMPQHLVDAFLSAEDRSFFDHAGISFRGILRSVLVNLYYQRRVQGASTITQQLVRLLFFNASKTFSRKIKEQVYSVLIERQCSKEQILEAYLNNVYFGYGIYGVQAAAQRFWKKDVADISVSESAILAAIMRSPKKYCPINSVEPVTRRRNLILKLMFDLGYISEDLYKESREAEIVIVDPDSDCIAPHLKETIRIFLEDLVDHDDLYVGGLTIQTTLNIDIQNKAQKYFKHELGRLKNVIYSGVDGGLISMDSETGEIRAMVGGYDFKESKLNRALQAHRQMGSIFKIFVYAAALEKGASFSDIELDEPLHISQVGSIWSPRNNNRNFIGPITRAYALSRSNNIVTIKTLLKAGVLNVIDLAKRCHIDSYMPPYPSLSLGCVDSTPIEALGSFNVIVNNGKYVEPHFISWVKNNVGDKIYKAFVKKEQVLDPIYSGQVARVLSFSIKRLRRVIGAKWFGGEALGKTGTTNDCRTTWFCGATPDLTTTIYIGADNNHSLGNHIYAAKTAFPIWFNIHAAIAKNKTNFYYDPKLKEVSVDLKTGKDPEAADAEIVSLLVNQ